MHRVAPALGLCAVLGFCAIFAGALVGGLHEVGRSVERPWGSLFFLYGAGRGFLVGLVVGIGASIIVPVVWLAASFIRLRFYVISRPNQAVEGTASSERQVQRKD